MITDIIVVFIPNPVQAIVPEIKVSWNHTTFSTFCYLDY